MAIKRLIARAVFSGDSPGTRGAQSGILWPGELLPGSVSVIFAERFLPFNCNIARCWVAGLSVAVMPSPRSTFFSSAASSAVFVSILPARRSMICSSPRSALSVAKLLRIRRSSGSVSRPMPAASTGPLARVMISVGGMPSSTPVPVWVPTGTQWKSGSTRAPWPAPDQPVHVGRIGGFQRRALGKLCDTPVTEAIQNH